MRAPTHASHTHTHTHAHIHSHTSLLFPCSLSSAPLAIPLLLCQDRFKLNRDFVELNTKLDTKLGYIIDLLEGHARINDPARRLPFETQGSSSGAGTSEVEEEEEDGEPTPSRPARGRGARAGGKQPRRA